MRRVVVTGVGIASPLGCDFAEAARRLQANESGVTAAPTWALPDGWVGLTCVTWSVRGLDSRQTTAGAIVSRVAPRLGPGAIVALHDDTGFRGGTDRAPTLAARDCLLSGCRTRGLRCVALGDAAAVRG